MLTKEQEKILKIGTLLGDKGVALMEEWDTFKGELFSKLDDILVAVNAKEMKCDCMPCDMTETNRLLQQLLDKENKPEDIQVTLELQ